MNVRTSFQARIALVLGLSLLLVVGVLYSAVKIATTRTVQKQAEEQLHAGARVFERLLDLRGERLQYGADWLAGDSQMLELVPRGDAQAIRRLMERHGAGVGASEMLLLDTDGKVIVSTLPQVAEGQPFRDIELLREASRDGRTMLIVVFEGRAFLLVQRLMLAPSSVARVLVVLPMDGAFATELQRMTNLQVSFLVRQGEQVGPLFSTLAPDLHGVALRDLQAYDPGGAPQLDKYGGQRFLSQALQLTNGPDGQVLALLQSPLDQALQAFAALDRQILWIALAALVLSGFGAYLIARRVSRPVSVLAAAAQRIGEGDYRSEVVLRRRDELGLLGAAINAMQLGLARRELQLAHNALHDSLTGLPNRALAMERLGSAISARRSVALIYLGIENYRAINQTCGPEGVEQMMRDASRILRETLPVSDTAARVTGNEFLLLLESTEVDMAVCVADRLHGLLTQPQRIGSHDITREICMGLAFYPEDGLVAEDLIARASLAHQDAAQSASYLQLYREGRDLAHQRQIRLIHDLREVAGSGQLLLHYQPKLDIRDGRVRQAEALLRWQHPEFGAVSPAEFIPLAERTGSIYGLTCWVIEEGIRQVAEWNTRGIRVQLSLNISADDLQAPGLVPLVERLLARHSLGAEQLVFEITESAVMRDPQRALEVLERLRGCGISLSVDDFGTGYSSLAHLKRLPVQELKIDQSFVRDLDAASEDAVIVRSTIEMSHNLGLKVVAEGVEYQHSLDLLERWHCDTAQGYLISRPLDARAFEAWVANLAVTAAERASASTL